MTALKKMMSRVKSMFGYLDQNFERKKRLDTLEKKIRKSSVKVFYDVESSHFTVAFAEALFLIHRFLKPLIPIFMNTYSCESEKRLFQSYLIEYGLSPRQRELYDHFLQQSLVKAHVHLLMAGKSREECLYETQKSIRSLFSEYIQSLSREYIMQVNIIYNTWMELQPLIRFPLGTLIHAFAPAYREAQPANAEGSPFFYPLKGTAIQEALVHLHNTISSIQSLPSIHESIQIFAAFKEIPQIDEVEIRKFSILMHQFVEDDGLLMILQHVQDNPYYTPISRYESHNIVASYIRSMEEWLPFKVEYAIELAQRDWLQNKVKQLFGLNPFPPLSFYSNEYLHQQIPEDKYLFFKNERRLNYLRVFLMKIYYPTIRQMLNDFIAEELFQSASVLHSLKEIMHQQNHLGSKIAALNQEARERLSSIVQHSVVQNEKGGNLSIQGDSPEDHFWDTIQIAIHELDQKSETIVDEGTHAYKTLGDIASALIHDSNRVKIIHQKNWRFLLETKYPNLIHLITGFQKQIQLLLDLIR